MTNIVMVSAAAMFDRQGRVLVQQRPAGSPMAGLWEFPGGKIEPAETPRDALARELEEELGIVVAADALTPIGFASEPLGARHLLLLLFACRIWAGEPRALYATALRWVCPDELGVLPMPPADRPLLSVVAASAAAGDQPVSTSSETVSSVRPRPLP